MRRASAPAGTRTILYGETPYGWRLSEDRSKLVVDKDERRLISVVRHMFFIERIKMRAIVEILLEAGVVNRRGQPFSLSAIWEIVHRSSVRPAEAGGRTQGR